MITQSQLNSIGYFICGNQYEFFNGSFDYLFNIRTQDLWSINDGVGEPEFVCKCVDIKELIKLLKLNP